MSGIEKQGAPDDKFQYLGQEKQEELEVNWLDFNFRQYDPQLGRFHAPDPITGIIPSITPYQYAFNNPINFSDPTGLFPEGGIEQEYSAGGGGGGKKPKSKKPGNCIQCKDKPVNRNSSVQIADNTRVSSNYIDQSILIGSSSNQSKPSAPNTIDNNTSNTATGVALAGAATTEIFEGVTIAEIIAAGGTVLSVLRYASPLLFLSFEGDTRSDSKPVTVPITTTGSGGEQRYALGVHSDLFTFSIAPNVRAMPYTSGWASASDDAQTVVKKLMMIALTNPNATFHFNLTAENGRVDDPINQKVFARNHTTLEFQALIKFFPARTTFYIKSGTIYKKTTPIPPIK